MFPLETSKAGLTRIDFDIINFLERPRTLDDLKQRFPEANVAKRLIELQDKDLIQERDNRYVSKLYTNNIKKIIDDSTVSYEIKKMVHFFLSQIDNPYVRERFFNKTNAELTDEILGKLSRSKFDPLSKKEMIFLKIKVNDLVTKLR